MNDGSANHGSPGVETAAHGPARWSWRRRVGVALLAIVWIAWLVIGLVLGLASSLALGDHSGSSGAVWPLLIIWTVPLGVIGAMIIWFTPRSARD